MDRRSLLVALFAAIALGAEVEDAEAQRRSRGRSRRVPRMRSKRRSRSGGEWMALGAADYYPNCASARAAGAAPIRSGEPGYSRRLDRDGDGIACE